MFATDALEGVRVAITYTERPDPVSPSQWADLRIARCLAILEHCHAGRATWHTFHVIDWALSQRDDDQLKTLMSDAVSSLDRPLVRFDPALDRALDRATGTGLIEREGAAWRLTPSGVRALERVKESGALRREIGQLAQLKRKITRRRIEEIISWKMD